VSDRIAVLFKEHTGSTLTSLGGVTVTGPQMQLGARRRSTPALDQEYPSQVVPSFEQTHEADMDVRNTVSDVIDFVAIEVG